MGGHLGRRRRSWNIRGAGGNCRRRLEGSSGCRDVVHALVFAAAAAPAAHRPAVVSAALSLLADLARKALVRPESLRLSHPAHPRSPPASTASFYSPRSSSPPATGSPSPSTRPSPPPGHPTSPLSRTPLMPLSLSTLPDPSPPSSVP